MQLAIPVEIGDTVFENAVEFLLNNYPKRGLLVADENTYEAVGKTIEGIFQSASYPHNKIILPGYPTLVADETGIVQICRALNGEERTLIAAGSGTITDLTRFVAFQSRLPFISLPTAPSVDAYTSYTAAISIGHVKYSIPAKTASAVYAHLPSLILAPRAMVGAGSGDMIAKFTALADWHLAHYLVGEKYDKEIAVHARQATMDCVHHAESIYEINPKGIEILMNSLCVSGHCMAAVKSSRPAAGSEHSMAHFWEMKHQANQLPNSLHGQKTGVASLIIAKLYETLRQLSSHEAAERVRHFGFPDFQDEVMKIKEVYGPIANQVIANQASFLGNVGTKTEMIIDRIISQWDEIIEIAKEVPSPDEIRLMLEKSGACSKPEDINVSEEDVNQAIACSMYTRDRFTILDLNRILHLSI